MPLLDKQLLANTCVYHGQRLIWGPGFTEVLPHFYPLMPGGGGGGADGHATRAKSGSDVTLRGGATITPSVVQPQTET